MAADQFDREDVEAVADCLGDDAAQLRQENDEDERADNMDRAASMLTWMLLTHPAYAAGVPAAPAPEPCPRGDDKPEAGFGGKRKALLAHVRELERKAAMADQLAPVLAFLSGEAPLEGVWFGDPHPTEKGAFWWRKHLRTAGVGEDVMQPVGGDDGR